MTTYMCFTCSERDNDDTMVIVPGIRPVRYMHATWEGCQAALARPDGRRLMSNDPHGPEGRRRPHPTLGQAGRRS